jgi:hypothetical protein
MVISIELEPLCWAEVAVLSEVEALIAKICVPSTSRDPLVPVNLPGSPEIWLTPSASNLMSRRVPSDGSNCCTDTCCSLEFIPTALFDVSTEKFIAGRTIVSAEAPRLLTNKAAQPTRPLTTLEIRMTRPASLRSKIARDFDVVKLWLSAAF